MKQGFLLFIFSIFCAVLNAQDVPEIQTPLITKRTATWCSNCGAWGWTMFEGLVEDNSDKAILMAAHHSGDLVTPAGQAITDNFMAIGQPRFYLGNEDQNVSSNSVTQKLTEIKDLVDVISMESPIANVGMNAFLIDGQITVETKTRFFQSATGEHYLGLYILEDDVWNNQAVQGMTFHKAVLRGGFTDDAFGIPLNTMPMIDMETDFDNSFTLEMNTEWDSENITVIGIIWKKEDDTYQFVNANSTTEFSLTATEDVIAEVSNFEVFPTLTDEEATAQITLKENVEDFHLTVYDLIGRELNAVFRGNLNQGVHTFSVNRSAIDGNGLYFVTIEVQGKRVTKKVIFR